MTASPHTIPDHRTTAERTGAERIHTYARSDFARGQRRGRVRGRRTLSFATGMTGPQVSTAVGSFATGMARTGGLGAGGDFATGQRTLAAPVTVPSAAPADRDALALAA